MRDPNQAKGLRQNRRPFVWEHESARVALAALLFTPLRIASVLSLLLVVVSSSIERTSLLTMPMLLSLPDQRPLGEPHRYSQGEMSQAV